MNLRLSIFYTLLGVMALSACSSSRDQQPPVVLAADQRGSLSGAIDQEMSEAYSEDNEDVFDPCDFENRDKIKEISKVLEARRSEIETFAKKAGASEETILSKETFTSFGNFKFKNPSEQETPKDEWKSGHSGAAELFAMYDQIKNTPVSEAWVDFNVSFRGFAYDDYKRLNTATLVTADRASTPLLEKALLEAEACLKNPSCLKPSLPEDLQAFLNSSAYLRLYFKMIEDPVTDSVHKRKYLQTFRDMLFYKIEARTFAVNPFARVEGKVLVIPMDTSVFGSDEKKFIQYLESEWNIDPAYKLRIEPIKKPTKGFRVDVSNVVGERARVNMTTFVMQLYNLGRMRTLVHEFGHVIGLPDTYYTTWDAKKCSYKDEWNPGDLMSSSTSGVVLPSHWDEIKKAYWKK